MLAVGVVLIPIRGSRMSSVSLCVGPYMYPNIDFFPQKVHKYYVESNQIYEINVSRISNNYFNAFKLFYK